MSIKFLRKSEIIPGILPISKSTFHNYINEGLLPPPVSLGDRAVAWPEHEINSVCRALIKGLPKKDIKALVSSLIVQRNEGAV